MTEVGRYIATKSEFSLTVGSRRVPGVMWTPGGATEARPLVLVGHGGSGHKASQIVLDAMLPLVEEHAFVVAAIDGPVHGDRRSVPEAGPVVNQEFRDLWAKGGSIDPMIEDWRAALDLLCEMPNVDANAIGWYGLSMGTAYGLPLLPKEPRIAAAVLGMWGTCRVNSERLARDARSVRIPVLFQQKADDELFTADGQIDLYNHISSTRKRRSIYPGGHTNPTGQQLLDALAFLVEQLTDLSLPSLTRS